MASLIINWPYQSIDSFRDTASIHGLLQLQPNLRSLSYICFSILTFDGWRSPEPPCGSESRTLCIAPRAACLQSKICIYPSRSSCLGAGLCGGEERPSHWEKESCWGWKWREDNLGSWKGFWKRERLDFQGSDNGAEMVWMCEKQAGKPLRVSLKTESGELFHRENHTGWVILWEWIGGKPGSGGLI